MAKNIVGVYETPEETMNAIEGLTSKGYDTEDISVITTRNDTDYLEERTDADIANADLAGNEHQSESIWDKIKDYFTMDPDGGDTSQLSGVNISDDQLNAYRTELDDGKFLLAVDEAAATVTEENTVPIDSGLGTGGSTLYSSPETADKVDRNKDDSTHTVTLGADEDSADPGLDSDRNTIAGNTPGSTNGDVVTLNPNGSSPDVPPGTPNRVPRDTANADSEDSTFGAGKLNQEDEGLQSFNNSSAGRSADMNASASNTANTSSSLNGFGTKEEKSMELREEVVDVNKREVKTGDVTIGKDVETEEKSFDVPVKHEEVYVERRSVDGDSEERSAAAVDGSETIHVPIVEEKLEVNKKPVVNEEIVVGKRTVEEQEHVNETVKKEKARLDNNGNGAVHTDNPLDE